MITSGEYPSAGLHELRNSRLLSSGKRRSVEPK